MYYLQHLKSILMYHGRHLVSCTIEFRKDDENFKFRTGMALNQVCPTCGPRAARGKLETFVRPLFYFRILLFYT